MYFATMYYLQIGQLLLQLLKVVYVMPDLCFFSLIVCLAKASAPLFNCKKIDVMCLTYETNLTHSVFVCIV